MLCQFYLSYRFCWLQVWQVEETLICRFACYLLIIFHVFILIFMFKYFLWIVVSFKFTFYCLNYVFMFYTLLHFLWFYLLNIFHRALFFLGGGTFLYLVLSTDENVSVVLILFLSLENIHWTVKRKFQVSYYKNYWHCQILHPCDMTQFLVKFLYGLITDITFQNILLCIYVHEKKTPSFFLMIHWLHSITRFEKALL